MPSSAQKDAFAEGLAYDVINNLKRRCPVDNGALRASIKFERDGTSILITMNEYGKYVEYGTPPHVIRPKNRKVLRFESGRKARLNAGKGSPNITFAGHVNHPGTRPQPFIRPTFRDDLVGMIVANAKRLVK